MSTNNLEDELRNLKLAHPTDADLAAYCDRELDPMRRALVEAHVKECFRCEKELGLLLEESAALNHGQNSAEDVALVDRLLGQTGSAPKPFAAGWAEIEISLQERIGEYLRQMVANWQSYFGEGALRAGPDQRALRSVPDQDEEVWRWRSEDGKLQARATIEDNADLAIHFSSNEMKLEGARLNIRLGALSQEITLRRVSESEIGAKAAMPWRRRPRNMADISIESVSDDA